MEPDIHADQTIVAASSILPPQSLRLPEELSVSTIRFTYHGGNIAPIQLRLIEEQLLGLRKNELRILLNTVLASHG